jgi:hypothetical protein
MRAAFAVAPFAALALASAVEGCSGGGHAADSGVALDAAPADGSLFGVQDGSVAAGCDPVALTGCGTGKACLYVGASTVSAEGPTCLAPSATPAVLGQPCTQSPVENCVPGSTCIQLTGVPNQTLSCQKLCHVGTKADCAGASTGTVALDCVYPISQAYGICGPTCEPFHDTCGAGYSCEATAPGVAACLPEGTVAIGGKGCQMNGCVRGGVCFDIGDGDTCYPPCDPAAANGCGMAAACVSIRGFDFGVCIQTCNPANDTCPAGDSCRISGVCLPEGAQPGQPCTNACTKGYVCVSSSGSNLVCKKACDPAHPMCMAPDTCVPIQGQTFGACG